jgi:POT family proton-dependent oligopeptide transporter
MGELYFSPIGLALTARVAPAQVLSMMMGLWLMTSFVGNQLQGIIGSFFDSMDKKAFFLMCAGVAMIPTVVFWFFNIPLRKTLHQESGQVGPVPEPATPFIEPER